MKKLSKLKLSDAKVMDVHEMKAITGGQYAYKSCKNTSTSTGANGGSDNITCSGECPTVQSGATGSTGSIVKKVCKAQSSTMGQLTVHYCDCV